MDRGDRQRLAWALYEWAQQPYWALIATFIFVPYFAAGFVGDATRCQSLLGYSGAVTDLSAAAAEFVSAAGSVLVCRNGAGVDFSEEAAKKILSEDEITISVSLGNGPGAATAWGCDLSYEYVRINGDYRT